MQPTRPRPLRLAARPPAPSNVANETRLEGANALDATLAELPQLVERPVLGRALRRALAPFDKTVRSRAPYLTGELRDSFNLGGHEKLTGRQKKLVRGQRPDKYQELIHYGTADPAGFLSEFGTSRQKAKPFFRSAWEAHKDDLQRDIGAELGKNVVDGAIRAAARNKGRG